MAGVSVIIPTYNRSAYLKEAVTSVIEQKGVTPEIIVVDDGSSDNTASVMRAVGSRCGYMRQTHAGVSSARNSGIKAAKGEWLAFLDSDDLWLPEKLSVQLNYVLEHPEFRICQTEEIWIRNGQRLNPKQYHLKAAGHCFSRLLERCLVSPSAVLVHRDVFQTVGLFDESLPACEDYDMWLRIGCRYPIGLVDRKLTIKRGGHPDQLSARVPALDRYRIQAIVKLLRTEPLSREQQRMALQTLERKCRIFGEGCRRRGSISEAEMILSLPSVIASDLGLPPENR